PEGRRDVGAAGRGVGSSGAGRLRVQIAMGNLASAIRKMCCCPSN
ncbi:SERGEF isoform 10, partial [Pan troglodytes]